MRERGRLGAFIGEWGLPIAEFAILLLVGLLIRFAAILLPGHSGDVSVMVGWAQLLAADGPGAVYQHILSVYPALLYLLWPLGIIFHGPALELVIKGLSIPFDLAIATLIAIVTLHVASRRAAFVAASLYLLNPAVILAGSVWGQIDAAGTLAMLGALVASSRRRHALAGGLGALAALCKPQFGLVLLPVLTVAALTGWRGRRWSPPTRALTGAVAVYILVAAPLHLEPLRYWQQLSDVAAFRPFASLYAMNPWGLLLGFETPERGFAPLGLLLLLIGLAGSLVPLRRRSDLTGLLASGALVALAFYFLPTRVHERYLFPAMAILAPLAIASGRQALAYVVLSLGFSLSLLYTLVEITPFGLPRGVESVLVSAPAIWAIGLTLMGTAVTWVLLLWRSVWSGDLAGDARHIPQPLDP